MNNLLLGLLMYVVLPLWIVAGLIDWWCHKHTRIELTSGYHESAFHLVMFIQTGLGALAAMLLQINLGLLALLAFLFLLHEGTTWLELRFVIERRQIKPFEQMIHSFMELLPLVAILLLAGLYDGSGAWNLQLKTEPVLAMHLAIILLAVTFLNLVPLLEEAWRCRRHPPRGGSQH
jgi:hypothetical protein